MALIRLQDVRCEVRDRTLFHIDQITIQDKDRIGLVGANGAGKTTLLRVLAGFEEPTTGFVERRTEVSYIPQLKPYNEEKSGGEISLATIDDAMSQSAGLLVADEPTTHLDLENVERLEERLKMCRGACIVVSHDRKFLDEVCSQIWEMEDGQVHIYKGDYSTYQQQKELEIKHHEKRYEKYVQKRKQLEDAMIQKERKAERATYKPKSVSSSEARITGAKPYFAKKQKKLHSGVSSIQTRLDQLEKVEKKKEDPPIKMELINENQLKNRTIIKGEKLAGVIEGKKLWNPIDFSIKAGEKVAIIGPNGAGKTTFLKKIMSESEEIRISPSVSIGYFSQMLEVLNEEEDILTNVRKTSSQDESLIRIILARLGFFRGEVFKPIHVLSGGERVKVAIGKLLVSDANVLILDEPTNFLDIDAVESLESLFKDYPGTILYVSHDRRFLENTATRIFSFKNDHITIFDEDYRKFIESQSVSTTQHSRYEEELLRVEMEITNVLSQLSIEPTEELDQLFQDLLREKKNLENK
ncbi:ribosomal protection-like ABC-F family protein [Halalkalibacillus halophilus]|uniref:ribosomal protection-like ABC-F family protein n=1 Tax=Halalkalibacillus halophilus TaxID=392827 RepID=UPI0004112942|nr:ABC-F type ribosomal protection protein [Halalkalibacillus halophilus]